MKNGMNFFSFAKEFIKNRKQLGTPFPSSKYLAREIARHVIGQNIIELGAGQGQITRAILKKHPQISLTAFEINPGLIKNLSEIKDPRLQIIQSSAAEFPSFVSEYDCIISGLPLTSMPKETVHKILLSSRNSKRYIQYKYFPESKLLKKYFSKVKVRIVLRNPIPALVYICSN